MDGALRCSGRLICRLRESLMFCFCHRSRQLEAVGLLLSAKLSNTTYAIAKTLIASWKRMADLQRSVIQRRKRAVP